MENTPAIIQQAFAAWQVISATKVEMSFGNLLTLMLMVYIVSFEFNRRR